MRERENKKRYNMRNGQKGTAVRVTDGQIRDHNEFVRLRRQNSWNQKL